MSSIIRKQKSQIERFWEKVSPTDMEDPFACWRWTGCILQNGYGQFQFNGQVVPAHRVAFELTKGKVPQGKELDHLCRNHSCVNPNHLEIVTHRENILRGINVIATNSQVTHCPQGHPYDLFNTYRRPDGGRDCRLCQARRSRDYKAHQEVEV